MENIPLPEELLPKNLKKPAAFIAEKNHDLPDYGIHTGDLVIVEQDAEFVEGELSAFQNDKDIEYQLSESSLPDHRHFGKVVMVIQYHGRSPFIKLN